MHWSSILGPLLLLVYLNDLPKCSSFFFVFMYADNTTLSCNLSDISMDDLSVILNSELEKINNWLLCNKLSLNESMTKLNEEENMLEICFIKIISITLHICFHCYNQTLLYSTLHNVKYFLVQNGFTSLF